MLKDRLRELFKSYDTPIQTIISEVLVWEQEHISRDRPRFKDSLDNIVTRVANDQLEQSEQSEVSE